MSNLKPYKLPSLLGELGGGDGAKMLVFGHKIARF